MYKSMVLLRAFFPFCRFVFHSLRKSCLKCTYLFLDGKRKNCIFEIRKYQTEKFTDDFTWFYIWQNYLTLNVLLSECFIHICHYQSLCIIFLLLSSWFLMLNCIEMKVVQHEHRTYRADRWKKLLYIGFYYLVQCGMRAFNGRQKKSECRSTNSTRRKRWKEFQSFIDVWLKWMFSSQSYLDSECDIFLLKEFTHNTILSARIIYRNALGISIWVFDWRKRRFKNDLTSKENSLRHAIYIVWKLNSLRFIVDSWCITWWQFRKMSGDSSWQLSYCHTGFYWNFAKMRLFTSKSLQNSIIHSYSDKLQWSMIFFQPKADPPVYSVAFYRCIFFGFKNIEWVDWIDYCASNQ